MAQAPSDLARRTSNLHFGQADLLAYDTATTKFVSFGYTQDTTLEVAWEQTELKAGSPAINIDTEITSISVTLTVQLLELSASNLAKLLPTTLVQSSVGAVLENFNEIVVIPAQPTKVKMRFPLLVKADGTVAVDADVLVKSTDGVTTYTPTVDYAITAATGEINAVAAGALAAGGTVKVQYWYNDTTATVINMGGRQCSATAQSFHRLQAISRTKTCAYRGVEIYKASPQSPLSIPFQNNFTVLEAKFVGQDDESRALGQNLFKFILGSASQI